MKQKFNEHTAPFSYITSPLLDDWGIPHAFTRRWGGVSEGVYSTFNFAAGNGEKPDRWYNVMMNHRIAASLFCLTEKDICRTYQTHSTEVRIVDERHRGVGTVNAPFEQGVDGLVTGERDLILSVRGADCVTILFFDVVKKICGACHSGWRGTADKIAARVVEKMVYLGADPKNILVAIGPSVGGCCYTVGSEVENAFLAADGDFTLCFNRDGEHLKLDLQRAVELTLLKAGVPESNISDCGECTVCDGGKQYFSHRLCGVDRGTMAAFIRI